MSYGYSLARSMSSFLWANDEYIIRKRWLASLRNGRPGKRHNRRK